MGKRRLKHWLKEYANYTRYSESPDLFHFWTGVAMIAGALRRQVWMDERYFQWTPNFYIVLVGPPGVAAKSTSVRIGTKLLEKVEGVNFGPQAMTWQSLTKSLDEAKVLVPHGGELLPMSCITCVITELGTFLKPEDKDLVPVLISLWDGQKETWRKETKSAGKDAIENPWINIIGCTTPSWLRDNYPESLIEGGLTSRIVFVYGDKKRHLVPYPSEIIEEEYFSDEGKRLVEDLQRIGEMCGQYKRTKEATAWGSAWYEQLWLHRPQHLSSERFSGYVARKQTHLHKVAMVLAAAQRDELIITEDDLTGANDMLTALEKDMQIVFQSIGAGTIARPVAEIMSYIKAYKLVTQRTLWRRCMPTMDIRLFMEAIRSALEAGYIEMVTLKGEKCYAIAKQEKE